MNNKHHLVPILKALTTGPALPLNQDCNHAAGPVFDDGVIWYLTATPDLVGVNLVSISPDGTRSSAFDRTATASSTSWISFWQTAAGTPSSPNNWGWT